MLTSILNKFNHVSGLSQTIMRFFDMHEYQSKILMRKYNVNVKNSEIAQTPDEAFEVSSKLDPTIALVLKCQVHAGGRGKGHLTSGLQGGVKICKKPEEIKKYAEQMIGFNLITKQTPKEGLHVKSVMVEEGVDIVKQLYFAFILDRKSQGPAIIASKHGGMEIEEVAEKHPESMVYQPIDIKDGITDDIAKSVVEKLGLSDISEQATEQMRNMYKMFCELDCTQLEINPWATDKDNKIICVDAKINVDDNAKYRQKLLMKMKKESVGSEEVDPHEEKATAVGLNYVALNGNIGCMVNGAGLAMATMDIVHLHGGKPANFLDVGGGADVEQIKTAFQILSSHPSVKAILINIFGGILRCDKLAKGIIKAAEIVDLKLPLIVRMKGTNAEEGKKLLSEFTKLKITSADDINDAAIKAVEAIKELEN